jgi:Na+-transporting methylmalonyl-CoA/oxaloacetate decarboxylase gamma subunit
MQVVNILDGILSGVFVFSRVFLVLFLLVYVISPVTKFRDSLQRLT